MDEGTEGAQTEVKGTKRKGTIFLGSSFVSIIVVVVAIQIVFAWVMCWLTLSLVINFYFLIHEF